MKLLTAALDDEVFVRDYHASHSVENLLQTMSVVVPDLYPFNNILKILRILDQVCGKINLKFVNIFVKIILFSISCYKI